MKKIYTLLLICLLSVSVFAANHIITATQTSPNFSFTPNSLNVVVGDSITFTWGNGTHTTTSDVIPSGAATWNATLSSSSTTFVYVVTEPGSYTYYCLPHSPGMTGSFVATGTSGIYVPSIATTFNVFSPAESVYTLSYKLLQSSDVNIRLYDITGKEIMLLTDQFLAAGDYSENHVLNDIQKGLYLVELRAGEQRITKRVIID